MTATRIIDDHLELANIGTNSHAQIDTHIAAADDYVKRDGSLALTSDWDIGDTRKILADEIRARDGAGLKLYDDGGKGIFVEDGGNIGIGTNNPDHILQVKSSGYSARILVDTPNTTSYPGLEFRHNGDDNYRALIRSNYASGYPNLTFWTVSAGVIKQGMIILSNGSVGIDTNAPTAKLDINSDILRLRTAKTPASAGASGNTGDCCWDADFIYVCTATNSWERAAIAAW